MFDFLRNTRQKIGCKLNKLDSMRTCRRQWKHVEDTRDIVIISDITSEDAEQAVSNLRAELKKLCPLAKITTLNYFDKKVRSDANRFISADNSEYFSDDNFNWFYKIKSETLINHLKSDYDMAILISKGDKPYIPFIFQFASAKLLIGNKATNDSRMNFVIDATHRSLVQTNAEIIKYLKMFFC